MKQSLFLFLTLIIQYTTTFAQDLITETEACPANTLQFTAPADPNVASYAWDFCTGDLLETPEATLITSFINDTNTSENDAHSPEGLDIIFDGNEWFGFLTSKNGNSLIRAEFGNSLDNIPTYHKMDLGINRCFEIVVLKDDSGWYALVSRNFGGISYALGRLSFGNSLKNTPTVEEVTIDGVRPNNTYVLSPLTVRAVKDESDFIIILGSSLQLTSPSFDRTELLVMNFGNTITNTLSGSDVFQTSGIASFKDVIGLPSFDIIKDGDNWYGLACRKGNIYHLSFGNSLFNDPIVEDITTNLTGFDNTWDSQRIRLKKDGKNYTAFFTNINGNFVRLNFGDKMSNLSPSLTNFGNFGLLGQQQLSNRPSIAFDIEKQGSTWYAFVINRHAGIDAPNNVNQLVRVKFPNTCNALHESSTEQNPTNQFLESGTHTINLQTYDSNRNLLNTYTDEIEIKAGVVGNYTLDKQCLDETVNFNNISTGDESQVISWAWDFGDGATSGEKEPSHQYSTSGIYTTSLTITNLSGCVNTVTKDVRISNRPTADFVVKSIDCESGIVQFEDQSSILDEDIALGGSITTREWLFGDGTRYIADIDTETGKLRTSVDKGTGVGEQGPSYTIPGTYQVSLTITDDAGCSSTVTKEIILNEENNISPAFTWTDACVGNPVQFTDQSTVNNISGEITSWSWQIYSPDSSVSIGTSNLQNPTHTFFDAGVYPVKLTIGHSGTCSQSVTMSVEVKSSLPSAFSTSVNSGSAPLTIQFVNETNGANSFVWDFDNGEISTQESPEYTFEEPGSYVINFQAKNELGCGIIATQKIIVTEGPTSLEGSHTTPVVVYPNPATSNLFVKFKNNSIHHPKITLYNLLGEEVGYYLMDASQEIQELTLDYLTGGTYILKIEIGEQEWMQRIIKK